MTSDAADTRWAAARSERGQSFGAVAAHYAAWRPGYPAELVAFLAGGEAGHSVPRRILDLGAGTGQLTESLLGAGHDVVAADPSAGMLAQLTVRLPGVPTLVAEAEDLPLPAGDVDVVVAAHAAQWFDPAAAGREFRQPGGRRRRVASSSRIALLDDAGRDAYLGRVRVLLATHPDTREHDEVVVASVSTAYRLTPR